MVGKRLVEFFALDSNPPLVNTREISTQPELVSTRLSCKHSLSRTLAESSDQTMYGKPRVSAARSGRFSCDLILCMCRNHARAHVGQMAKHLRAHVNFDAHFLDFGTKYDRVVFLSDGSIITVFLHSILLIRVYPNASTSVMQNGEYIFTAFTTIYMSIPPKMKY